MKLRRRIPRVLWRNVTRLFGPLYDWRADRLKPPKLATRSLSSYDRFWEAAQLR